MLGSFGMVGTFFVVSNLKPWGKPRIFDKRITDDKHVMALDLGQNDKSVEELTTILKDTGASEVNPKSFED